MTAIANNRRSQVLFCIVIFFFAFILSWSFGGAEIYPWHLLQEPTEMSQHILLSIRLPRVVCACIVGGALAAAGVITQGLFRNPLASPSVIGISSGGLLGAILAFYLGASTLSLWSLPFFAFMGCVLTTLAILAFARSVRALAIEDLLLAGFALNGILSAVSSFILSLSLNDFDKAPAMMNWMLGTLNGKTWDHCLIGAVPISLALLLAGRIAYRFDVLSLGNDVAQSLGLELKRLRFQSVLTISVLVAAAVSVGGLLPFLGLIVPHLSRLLIGPEHRSLLRISIINGASLLLIADLLARTIIPPQEIQVGVLISLIGSPFFLWMIFQRRRTQSL